MNPNHSKNDRGTAMLIRAIQLCFLTALLWGCGSTQVKESSHTSAKGPGLSSLSEQQLSRYSKALSSLKAKKPKAAEKALTKLLSAKPKVAEIGINLALSQYQQKKYAPAQKTLNRLLKRSAPIAQAHNLTGLIAVQNGQFSEAVKHYKTAIQLKPNYDKALYNMALLQDIYLQDIALAISYYQKYLLLQADDERTKDWIEHLKSSLKN